MGTACCKLCAHCCMKPARIKSKVSQLYEVRPGMNEEFHTKIRARDLASYLKDRHGQILSCVKQLSRVSKKALCVPASGQSVRTLNITLHSLKILVEFPEFLNLAYDLCYMVITSAAYAELKEITFELLELCTTTYPETRGPFLEDILFELGKFASEHSGLSDREVRLMGNITVILKSEVMHGDGLRWEQLLEIGLGLVTKGHDEEELALVKVLAGFMMTDPDMAKEFISALLKYLDSNKQWNKVSLALFRAILSPRGNLQYLELFRALLSHLRDLLLERTVSPKFPCKCLFLVLECSREPVPSQFCLDLIREVIVLLHHSGAPALCEELVETWCRKTDVMSLVKFIQLLLFGGGGLNGEDQLCLHFLKKSLKRFQKLQSQLPFLYRVHEVMGQLIGAVSSTQDVRYLEYLYYFTQLYVKKFEMRDYEIETINTLLLNVLTRNEFSVEAFSYAWNLWELFAGLKGENKARNMLALCRTALELLDSQKQQPFNVALGLCVLHTLETLSVTHDRPELCQTQFFEHLDPLFAQELSLLFTPHNCNSLIKSVLSFSSEDFTIKSIGDAELINMNRMSENCDPLGKIVDSDRSSLQSSDNERIEHSEIRLESKDYYKALSLHEARKNDLLHNLFP